MQSRPQLRAHLQQLQQRFPSRCYRCTCSLLQHPPFVGGGLASCGCRCGARRVWRAAHARALPANLLLSISPAHTHAHTHTYPHFHSPRLSLICSIPAQHRSFPAFLSSLWRGQHQVTVALTLSAHLSLSRTIRGPWCAKDHVAGAEALPSSAQSWPPPTHRAWPPRTGCRSRRLVLGAQCHCASSHAHCYEKQ